MSQYPDPERPVASLDPSELRRRLASESITLLDVRNRSEIEEWRLPVIDRTEIPYVKFVAAEANDDVAALVGDVDEPVVVVCGRGAASAYVAGLLQEAGIEAVNLDGGMEEWAGLYETAVVSEAPTVVQYDRPSSGCLAHLIVDGGEAAVVDPLRAFADRYVTDAANRGTDLRYALDTHVHADHVSGVRALADRGVEPVVPAGAVDRGLVDPERFTLLSADDGDELAVGETTIEAGAAPGHTSEMTAYRVADLLLAGDGLFARRIPRPDLEAGAAGAADHARELHRTLTERFAPFNGDLSVAPGHYDPEDGREAGVGGAPVVPLGAIRERVAAFGMDREAFVERVLDRTGERPANHERIVAVNLGRETVEDREAFELELGPNDCAAG
jgi:glyoxylase-like metal-dependent hydrolase (beta-lactamase superfamily II)/rhodanese-related sulfurtransferase